MRYFKEDLKNAIRHGMLVSNLAAMVAKELGEGEEVVRSVAIAGILHDIGKLRLTSHLYGRDSDTMLVEEMKYTRMHSQFSYEIAMEQGFSEDVAKMVYHHHENYNGSGYPDNLKGSDIPWGARVIRICDEYSALISKRPYRDAFSREVAFELMVEGAKNYDMDAFLAFQRILHSDEYEALHREKEYRIMKTQTLFHEIRQVRKGFALRAKQ